MAEARAESHVILKLLWINVSQDTLRPFISCTQGGGGNVGN